MGGTIYILSGIGKHNVGRLSNSLVRVVSLGIVLGWWGGGDPWLSGSKGLSLVGLGAGAFYVAVFHVRGALPPLEVGVFSWFFLIHLALARLAFYLKQNKNESKIR